MADWGLITQYKARRTLWVKSNLTPESLPIRKEIAVSYDVGWRWIDKPQKSLLWNKYIVSFREKTRTLKKVISYPPQIALANSSPGIKEIFNTDLMR